MTYAMHCAGCGWKGEISCHVLELDGQLCPECGAPRPTLRQDYSQKQVCIPTWFHEGTPADVKQRFDEAYRKNPDRFEYVGPRRTGREVLVSKGRAR